MSKIDAAIVLRKYLDDLVAEVLSTDPRMCDRMAWDDIEDGPTYLLPLVSEMLTALLRPQ